MSHLAAFHLRNALSEHDCLLGALVSYLHSLEYALRVFLYERGEPPHTSFAPGANPYSLKVGELAPENAFTSYDTLGSLIRKYNKHVSSELPDLRVDDTLLETRDAIAHGRIAALQPALPFRLLKFSRPAAGSVPLATAVLMTPEWLTTQRDRASEAASRVEVATDRFREGAA